MSFGGARSSRTLFEEREIVKEEFGRFLLQSEAQVYFSGQVLGGRG